MKKFLKISLIVVFILSLALGGVPILVAQFNYKHNTNSLVNFSAYSENGYIENQDATSVFKYGFSTADKTGCGFIAVYNVLTYLKKQGLYEQEINLAKIIKTFDSYGTNAYAFLGTNPLVMKWYLQHKGFKVNLSTKQQNFKTLANQAEINIICYIDKGLSFGHYKMVEKDDGNTFKFHTIYYEKTMEQFLEDNSNCFIFLMTISI